MGSTSYYSLILLDTKLLFLVELAKLRNEGNYFLVFAFVMEPHCPKRFQIFDSPQKKSNDTTAKVIYVYTRKTCLDLH